MLLISVVILSGRAMAREPRLNRSPADHPPLSSVAAMWIRIIDPDEVFRVQVTSRKIKKIAKV
jgi:hypothetical protein